MSRALELPNKGTNLEPIPYWSDQPQQRRSQLQLFLASDAPEVEEVTAAVAETLREYAFVRNNEDFRKVIGFTAWRTLVNRERAQQEQVIEGNPRLVPKVVSDGEGGYKIVRPDKDPMQARIDYHSESDGTQIEGEQ